MRGMLPAEVAGCPQQNLADNTERTHSMIEEAVAIQLAFQNADVSYSVLKGLSLFPLSVRRPELRHQFGLDFLVTRDTIEVARRILELRGYRLYAVRGNSWGFKRNEAPFASMDNMYKTSPCSAVELHVETRAADRSGL